MEITLTHSAEYEITPDDLFAYQWRAAYKSPLAQRTRRNMYLYLFLALLLLSIIPAIGRDGFVMSRISIGFLVISYALVAALTWAFDRRATGRLIKELVKREKPGKGQIGRHSLTIDDHGVIESTEVGESRSSWAGIDRVEQNEDYIFIYTAPAAAHIVPRRAFTTPADAEMFYELAKSSKEKSG